MNIRCIWCARPESQVMLDKSNFQCVDRENCMIAQAHRGRPVRQVSVWFDGACLGSNTSEGQPLGIGVYTKIDGKHAPEWSGAKAIEWGTNNDAEFVALLHALSVAKLMRKEDNFRFKIFGDSQVIIRIVNGEYKCGVTLKPYLIKANKLKKDLGETLLGIYWLKREFNTFADALSKEALLQHEK